MRDTIFQLCLYITIGMVVFSLIFSLLAGISVFSEEQPKEGIEIETTDKDNSFYSITGQDLEKSLLLSAVTGSIIGIATGGLLSFLTKTTSGIGVGLFSGVFWGAYTNVNNIINAGSYLDNVGLMVIIHVVVGMLFVGAIIGMFTGSG